MQYKVEIPHAELKFRCCVIGHVNPRFLSVSQCGSHFARSCVVLNVFYGHYYLEAVTVC
jgi:hypothetical protein